MKNILKILDKKEYLSQSHYLVSLIKTVQYDTIYHEHMRYYSLTSLNYLFRKYKLKILCKKFQHTVALLGFMLQEKHL